MFELVVGTGNAKKLIELQMLLPAESIKLLTLADVEAPIDVEETGKTFSENAALKATEQAKHLGKWVVAEDSGLSVDALRGEPGVISARYAGVHGDNERNNAKLLEELSGVPPEKRTAHFSSYLCLSDPEGVVHIEENARCCGTIGTALTGSAGFGYDPLFIIPEYHRTFGELDLTVKRAISHRSRALRKFVPRLMELVSQIK